MKLHTGKVLTSYEEDQLGVPFRVILRNCVKEVLDESGNVVGYHVPDLDGLAATVGLVRAMLPHRLSGEEMRFLRKTLALTSKKFAGRIDVDPSSYSRYENNKEAPGGYVEKLLRHYVCAELAPRAPSIDYDPRIVSNLKIKDRLIHDDIVIELERVKVIDRLSHESLIAWDNIPQAA